MSMPMSKQVVNHIKKHKVPANANLAFILLVPPSCNVSRGQMQPADCLQPHDVLHDQSSAFFSKIWAVSGNDLEEAILKMHRHVRPQQRDNTEVVVGILCHTNNTKSKKRFDWNGTSVDIDRLEEIFRRSRVHVMLFLGCTTLPSLPMEDLFDKILISTLKPLDFDSLYHFYVRFTNRMVVNKNRTHKSLLERTRRSMDEAKTCQISHGSIQINN